MNIDAISTDLDGDIDAQDAETAEKVKATDASSEKVTKVFGFNSVPIAVVKHVRRFLADIEAETGLKGEEAFAGVGKLNLRALKPLKLRLNKSFQTRVSRSDRVIKVAEAFGLGLEDRVFTVLDQVELDVTPGDVIYINGQSGAGKSVLLRELAKALADNGQRVSNIDEVRFDDAPLIDQIGKDSMAEAIRLLSIAGLSDAYLYIRNPAELRTDSVTAFAWRS
jgi:ABC-type ATPase with predicted acetyltransferase domain